MLIDRSISPGIRRARKNPTEIGTEMSEFRQDPVVGKWVIFSAARGKRPSDFNKHEPQQPSSTPGPCAFCPQREHETGEELFALPDHNDSWQVRVVKNKFPAVSVDFDKHQRIQQDEDDPFRRPGFGSHEVVIETPDHDVKFSCLSSLQVQGVFKAYRERMLDFRRDGRFKYVQVFKNKGNLAGASMQHSHSQIIALPFIPQDVRSEIEGSKTRFQETGKCVLCEVLHQNLLDGKRLIDCSPEYAVIAPYAPQYPYETWIVPRTHASNFEDANDSQLLSLASVLLSTLQKMDLAFDNPPFNYTLQTSPVEEHRSVPYYHWSLRILPHLVTLGGFELGSGCHINPVFPEDAAKTLRKIDFSSMQEANCSSESNPGKL